MTLKALDSAYPPSALQIAAAKAAGYAGWNGYFAGQNILNGWSDGDFRRVLAGGLKTLAFCSGWSDPTAMRIRGESLGIPIMADVEGGIRGDGPWLQPWLDVSKGGLYANYWVFPGKRATRNMLCAYPTSGDSGGASWSVGYVARPSGPCGWQWAGSHNEFGVTVDSEWLDDAFYGAFGPGGGTLNNRGKEMIIMRISTGAEFLLSGSLYVGINDAADANALIAAGIQVVQIDDAFHQGLLAASATHSGGATSGKVAGTLTVGGTLTVL